MHSQPLWAGIPAIQQGAHSHLTFDSEYCTLPKKNYMVHRTFLERFALITDEYNALCTYCDVICRRPQLLCANISPARHGRDSSPQRWARSRTLILTQSRLFLQHNFIWCVEPFMSYLYSSLMNLMLCADTARSSISVLSCCGRKSSPRGRRESRSYSRAPSRTILSTQNTVRSQNNLIWYIGHFLNGLY